MAFPLSISSTSFIYLPLDSRLYQFINYRDVYKLNYEQTFLELRDLSFYYQEKEAELRLRSPNNPKINDYVLARARCNYYSDYISGQDLHIKLLIRTDDPNNDFEALLDVLEEEEQRKKFRRI